MTKFTDLSHVLVEKYQLSQNDANTFISSFVAPVIAEITGHPIPGGPSIIVTAS